MHEYISTEDRQELCKKMAANLPTIRTKSNITQDELANRLGLARQTISAIENDKQEMQWSTFSVLIMFFVKNIEVRQILETFGIVNDDVIKTLNIDWS